MLARQVSFASQDTDDAFASPRARADDVVSKLRGSPGPQDDGDDCDVDMLDAAPRSPVIQTQTVVSRRGALAAAAQDVVPRLEACLPAILRFLSARDVVQLATVSRACADLARAHPLRLDTLWGPLCGRRQLRLLARARRAGWLLGGVQLHVPDDDAGIAITDEPQHADGKSDADRALRALARGGAAVEVLALSHSPRAPPLLSALTPRALPSLRELRVSGARELRSLAAVAAACAGSLRVLSLDRCAALADVSALGQLPRLTHLTLRDCPAVSDLRALRGCRALQSLELDGSDQVRDVVGCLPDTAPRTLQTLRVSRCASVSSVAGVDRLLALEVLVLTQLPLLAQLPAVLPPRLRALRLRSCVMLTTVPALAPLRSLAHVDVSNTFIGDAEFLRGCGALRSADLALCRRLRALEPLADCPALQALSLWRCGRVQSLLPLRSCAALRWLDLTDVPRAEDAQAVRHVPEIVSDARSNVFAHRRPVAAGQF